MNSEMKRRMAESVQGFRLPRYSEIPNVGLYLEQTTKYINEFLAPLGCMEITSSMISNYVKKGLISSPVKKQYSAEQIAYLFFVAIAKNLTSMENISLLIGIQQDSCTVEEVYNYMCGEMENMIGYVFGLKDSVEEIGETDSDEKKLLRNLIVSVVNMIYMNACLAQLRGQEQHGTL